MSNLRIPAGYSRSIDSWNSPWTRKQKEVQEDQKSPHNRKGVIHIKQVRENKGGDCSVEGVGGKISGEETVDTSKNGQAGGEQLTGSPAS